MRLIEDMQRMVSWVCIIEYWVYYPGDVLGLSWGYCPRSMYIYTEDTIIGYGLMMIAKLYILWLSWGHLYFHMLNIVHPDNHYIYHEDSYPEYSIICQSEVDWGYAEDGILSIYQYILNVLSWRCIDTILRILS